MKDSLPMNRAMPLQEAGKYLVGNFDRDRLVGFALEIFRARTRSTTIHSQPLMAVLDP